MDGWRLDLDAFDGLKADLERLNRRADLALQQIERVGGVLAGEEEDLDFEVADSP